MALERFRKAWFAGEQPDVEDFCKTYGDPLREEIDDFLLVANNLSKVGRKIPTENAATNIPKALGDFRILRELGRGGMGAVFEAEQRSLKRKVALKLLPSHLSFSSEAVLKFRREAEAGGRQSHPGIVAVHAVGEHEGIHFIAQELVEGGANLCQHLQGFREGGEQPPGYFRTVGKLILSVTQALTHAHASGVIHRDIKPSNILITKEGRAKVTDFGLAKVEDALALSRTGDLAGTPYYMSPEQAFSGKGIDKRTDIFSLGVTLYEMLTLKLPFEGGVSHEVLKKILLHDPVDPHRENPRVPLDLSVIAMKAMEKDPKDRYQTMEAFGEDLKRYLQGDVILAQPTSMGARMWKRVKRNRVIALALLGVFLAIVIGLTAVFWVQMVKQAQLEEERAKLKETNTELKRTIYFDKINFIQQAFEQENAARMKKLLSECDPGLRGWEWRFFNSLSDTSVFTFYGRNQASTSFALSPDSKWMACVNPEGLIRFWDLQSLKEKQLSIDSRGTLPSFEISPDGARLLTSGIKDPTPCVWNVKTGKREIYADQIKYRNVSHFLPDGSGVLVITNRDQRFTGCILDANTGETIKKLPGKDIPCSYCSFSPDGERAASVTAANKFCIWNAKTWRMERELAALSFDVYSAFSPDGKFLAASGSDGKYRKLYVWDAHSFDLKLQRSETCLDLHATVAFSPDNRRLAWGNNALIRIINLATGQVEGTLMGHEDTILTMDFLADGRLITRASRADRMIKLWDIDHSMIPKALPEHKERIMSIRFTRDSKKMITASCDGELRYWDLASKKILARVQTQHNWLFDARLLPLETRAITSGRDKTIRIYNLETGEREQRINNGLDSISKIPFEFKGLGYVDAVLYLGFMLNRDHKASGKQVKLFVVSADFSPNGRHFVIANDKGELAVWDKTAGERLWSVKNAHGEKSGGAIGRVCYSPKGNVIVTCGDEFDDRFVRIWDANTGERLQEFEAHHQRVEGIDFSPDSKRLFTICENELPTVWDVETGRLVCTLPCMPISFREIRVSPNGRYVVAGGGDRVGLDGRLLLWELPETGQ